MHRSERACYGALGPLTTVAKGEAVTRASPLPIYTARGGLRQDPGRAAQSLAGARTYGNGNSQMRVLLSTYTAGAWLMTEHAVVIAGGGPTGLMLAGELALAKVDVAIVERRPARTSPAHARAVCTHARSRFS